MYLQCGALHQLIAEPTSTPLRHCESAGDFFSGYAPEHSCILRVTSGLSQCWHCKGRLMLTTANPTSDRSGRIPQTEPEHVDRATSACLLTRELTSTTVGMGELRLVSQRVLQDARSVGLPASRPGEKAFIL